MITLMDRVYGKQAAFLLGLTSILAQTILMRDLAAVFYGNELSYAVGLASWLVWVGLGSLFFQEVLKKVRQPQFLKPLLFLVLGIAVPLMIYGIHFIRAGFGLKAGEMIGLVPLFLSSFGLTAPVGFMIGAIFSVLCFDFKQDRPAEKVYLWESIGSASGGLLFAVIFVHILSTMVMAWVLALLCVGSALRSRTGSKWFFTSAICVFVLSICGIIFSMFFHLDHMLWQRQWPESKLLAVEDSPYGKISISRRMEQISIYQDGLLSFTAPDPVSAEEHVHLAMLAHPGPKRVLLIGNGLGGEIEEALKYPQVALDFVTMDSEAFSLICKHLPSPSREILNDRNLKTHIEDGRLFLKKTKEHYDVIIINTGDPHTARMNRYYTKDFFEEASRVLSPGGVFAVSASSSANYLSQENRIFLRSLNTTLKQVFPQVRSIPGDNHIFLASNLKASLDVTAASFIRRFEQARITTQFIQPYEIPFRLDPMRMAEVERTLEIPGEINRDLKPTVYLFNIALWSTHYDTLLSRLIERALKVPVYILGIVPIVIFSAGAWAASRKRQNIYILAVALSGFSEIIFEVVVILAFQSLYGIAYERIALILASFMAGLVFGVVSVGEKDGSPDRSKSSFASAQAGMVVYPLLLPAVFYLFRDAALLRGGAAVLSVVFACLPVVAGFMGGRQFILANRILDGESFSKGPFLYAWDVFGAAIGALLTATVLIPVYGIIPTCFLCVGMNLAIWLVLKIKGSS